MKDTDSISLYKNTRETLGQSVSHCVLTLSIIVCCCAFCHWYVFSLNNLSMSVSFNGHFPGGPVLAGTRVSPFWITFELKVMGVVVTTGAVRHAKFQSDCHYQQKHTQFFYRPDALPVAQPTVRALKGNNFNLSMSMGCLLRSSCSWVPKVLDFIQQTWVQVLLATHASHWWYQKGHTASQSREESH